MADPQTVPLSIVSSAAMNSFGAYATIAVGSNVLNQNVASNNPSYWFVVLDRSNLSVVSNQLQSAPDQVPSLGGYNDTNHILVVATLGLGLDRQPQGALFDFLDANGGGPAAAADRAAGDADRLRFAGHLRLCPRRRAGQPGPAGLRGQLGGGVADRSDRHRAAAAGHRAGPDPVHADPAERRVSPPRCTS
jgi:hypothetical protein